MVFFINFIICFFFIFPIFQKLEATTEYYVFKKYPNKYFVETGTHEGQSVFKALKAGFKEIYSIELSPVLHDLCCKTFANYPNVNLFVGNSKLVLPVLLNEIDEPATFWLDAHYSEGNTAKGDTMTPILGELECIKNHPIKTHTILIDDVRQFGSVYFDFVTLDQIKNKLLEINPDYEFSYENGYVANDVLVAQVKKSPK